jgi:hypothetical protein
VTVGDQPKEMAWVGTDIGWPSYSEQDSDEEVPNFDL